MSLIEIEGVRWLEQVGGKDFWVGQRSLLTEDGNTRSACLGLWGQSFPGFGGGGSPVCKRTRAIYHPSGVPGVSMIHAFYETRRQPNRAILTCQTRPSLKKIIKEPEAAPGQDTPRIIEGPDKTTDLVPFEWIVTKGDNVSEEYETVLRLRTAFYAAQFSLANIYSIRGCVNDGSQELVGFGTVSDQSLKCIGADVTKEYGGDMVDVDYLFAWSGPDENWNQKVESQPGSWVVRTTPVFDEDLNFLSFREGVSFMPGYKIVPTATSWKLEAADAESRITHWKKSFSILQGLTEW